ncbi:TPA: hypothetical protein ACSTJY_004568 [Serratia fonticola]|uniref:hypothetical protein n=1 Tax=Serratia fonticola TaxID=47917 RepID=UPI0034C60B85
MIRPFPHSPQDVQSLWLNAFEHLEPAPQTAALTPSEHELISPWRALNGEMVQGKLLKASSPFPTIPDWVKRCAKQSHRLAILYIHRYAKLDCRTPFLPWLIHQIGGGIRNLGLRHHDTQLSPAHLNLANAWAQEGDSVLVIFDHIKVIDAASESQLAPFIQYALLSTTPCPMTGFAPTSLGSTLCPELQRWPGYDEAQSPQPRRQVHHD